MGTKNNPGTFDCYVSAKPDEPMFTLLARDPSAPGLVEEWAIRRMKLIIDGEKPITDIDMVQEATKCADGMRAWRQRVWQADNLSGTPEFPRPDGWQGAFDAIQGVAETAIRAGDMLETNPATGQFRPAYIRPKTMPSPEVEPAAPPSRIRQGYYLYADTDGAFKGRKVYKCDENKIVYYYENGKGEKASVIEFFRWMEAYGAMLLHEPSAMPDGPGIEEEEE